MKKRFTFIEKLVCMSLILLMGLPFANALEFQRDKNVATYILAPIINATDNVSYATGANNTKFYISVQDSDAVFGAWSQAGANITILSPEYNFPLNQTEMNHQRIAVLYNGTGCLQQTFYVNTDVKEAIDAIKAETVLIVEDTGTTIPASIALIDGNVTAILADTATIDTQAELRTLLVGSDTALSTLVATDNIGINWADVAAPTTAVNLTQTDIRHVGGNVVGNVTNVTNPVSVNVTLAY